jgi:hypothetical protein
VIGVWNTLASTVNLLMRADMGQNHVPLPELQTANLTQEIGSLAASQALGP